MLFNDHAHMDILDSLCIHLAENYMDLYDVGKDQKQEFYISMTL